MGLAMAISNGFRNSIGLVIRNSGHVFVVYVFRLTMSFVDS